MADRQRVGRFGKLVGILLGFIGLLGIVDSPSAAARPSVLEERLRLEQRILAARDALTNDRRAGEADGVVGKIAQWVNWPNWGNWGNWPNWNNWNNWANWFNR